MVFHGGHVPDGFSLDDHLAAAVPGRLEQHRIHAGFRLDAGSLGLRHLGTAHFQPAARDKGIEGHVLRLERRDLPAVLLHNAEEGAAQDALSDG